MVSLSDIFKIQSVVILFKKNERLERDVVKEANREGGTNVMKAAKRREI